MAIYRAGQRCPRGHSRIVVTYGVTPNANEHRGGWMPVLRVNRGRVQGGYGRGFDRGEALIAARARAVEEAQHYGGDWCVYVRSSARIGRGKKR